MKKALIGAAVAAMLLPVAAMAERDGATVYNTKCAACHASGVAGAPMVGKADEWAPRVAQGMDVLYTHADQGLNAMPPRGMCMDCTDDELKAAISFMVENSK